MISGRGDYLEGKRISERYRIKTVRKWTEHTVFCLAEDMKSGQTVDMIMLEPNSIKDAALFAKELEKKSLLRHKNLRQIIAFGQSSDGEHFIAQELCDSNISKLLAGKTLSVHDALSYLFQIAEALEYLHKKAEIIILPNPQSILLIQQANGFILKLNHLQFSQKLVPAALLEEEELSLLSQARVKPPELIKGGKVDVRSQIYVLACLLYQMISGKVPFDSDDLVELESQHLCMAPRRIHELRPDLYIEPRFESVILKALSKEPAQRQSSIAQFKSELKDSLSKNPGLTKGLKTAAAVSLLALSTFCAMQLSGILQQTSPEPSSPIQNEPDPGPKLPEDPLPKINSDSANRIYTPEELGLPVPPKTAENLGVLKLSGLEKRDLKAGDYLCRQIDLSGKSHLKAGAGVRLWVLPASSSAAAISLTDESALLSDSVSSSFQIFDCSSSEIHMDGKSRLRAEVQAPAALLNACGESSIEGKFCSNGQRLSEKARFINSDSE